MAVRLTVLDPIQAAGGTARSDEGQRLLAAYATPLVDSHAARLRRSPPAPEQMAEAEELIRRRLTCKLPLLAAAADSAEQQQQAQRQGSQPGTTAAAAAAHEAAQAGHQALLTVPFMLAELGGSFHNNATHRQAAGLAALQAAEAAVDAAAAAFGWHWEAFNQLTLSARRHRGPDWWRASPGLQQCSEEQAMLYRGRSHWLGWPPGAAAPSVAELLETGSLGSLDWALPALPAPGPAPGVGGGDGAGSCANSTTAASDVPRVAGQLAVLNDRQLLWALPPDVLVGGRQSWSPPFALAGTLWRLVAFGEGHVLTLLVVHAGVRHGAEPLPILHAEGALAAVDTVSAVGAVSCSREGLWCIAPWHWVPDSSFTPDPVQGGVRLIPGFYAENGAARYRLTQHGSELAAAVSVRAVTTEDPGWEEEDAEEEGKGVLKSWAPLRGTGPDSAARLHPTPLSWSGQPSPVGGGSGALSVENKFWALLSRQEERRWRVPPATPAFRSRVLPRGDLAFLPRDIFAQGPHLGRLREEHSAAHLLPPGQLLVASTAPGMAPATLQRMARSGAGSTTLGKAWQCARWKVRWLAGMQLPNPWSFWLQSLVLSPSDSALAGLAGAALLAPLASLLFARWLRRQRRQPEGAAEEPASPSGGTGRRKHGKKKKNRAVHDEEGGLCVMCLDAPRACTLAPCGHRWRQTRCARTKIASFIEQVFDA
ncbi:hypothetical protein ABPG75_004106 [Micractinium tetrahymenae]